MIVDMDHDEGMGAMCACECATCVHVSHRPHTPTEDGHLRIVIERFCCKCKGVPCVPSAKAQAWIMAWWGVNAVRCVCAARACIAGVEPAQTPTDEEAEEQKEVTTFQQVKRGNEELGTRN